MNTHIFCTSIKVKDKEYHQSTITSDAKKQILLHRNKVIDMQSLRYFLTTPVLLYIGLFTAVTFADESKIRSPENIPGSILVDAEQVIDTAASIDNLVIIDSRISGDLRQGYIEDSISMPDIDTDCYSLSIHLKTKQSPVLFYCNGPKCGRSTNATRIALACGYKNIYWFRGGFEEWKEKDYPYIKNNQ